MLRKARQFSTFRMADTIYNSVQEYYGKTLKSSESLATNACTIGKMNMPKHIKLALSQVHEEVSNRFYGCGLIAPECLSGAKILDLGSGSGQDCFVLSKLVGQSGEIVGVDMTQEQLNVATQYIAYHTEVFGYDVPNTKFVKGYIEQLTKAGLQENHFDIIVSNCVINLVPDKRAVIKETFKVLKEGGEFYFSDVYADRILSDHLRKHELLWGECISGALYWRELVDFAAEEGFSQPYLVSADRMEVNEPGLKQLLGDAKFVSANYRLFKLPGKSEWLPAAQLIYNGQIPYVGDKFVFDHQTTFKMNIPVSCDSELVTSIMTSRYQEYFTQIPFVDGANAPEKKVPIDVIAYCANTATNRSSSCCAPKSPPQKTGTTGTADNGSSYTPRDNGSSCTPRDNGSSCTPKDNGSTCCTTMTKPCC